MSEYECYCAPQEGEPCEVWRTIWYKARKAHKCVECKEAIAPGERYEYTFFIFEGEPSYHRTCEFCVKEVQRIATERDIFLVPGDLACALVAELRGEL